MDIIIPTANNLEQKNYSLYFTLRSVLAQSITSQIFVVANGSQTDYEKLRKKLNNEFGSLVNILNGSKREKNISYARNLGVRAGKSEKIVFMDDDTILGNNTVLEQVDDTLNREDFYCGAYRFWTHPNWSDCIKADMQINQVRHILKAKSFLPQSVERLSGKQSFSQFTYIGNFGGIRRSVLKNIEGFDESFCGWTYQDTDLMMRLCVQGYRYELMSHDGLYVYHLSHAVDKSKYRAVNKSKYRSKQQKFGKRLNVNHFFGIYDDEKFELIEPFNQ